MNGVSRRSYLLPVCLVGGILLIVVACWLWSARGPELATLRNHRGVVRSVAFSSDGALLASAGEDRQILVWDAATGPGRYQVRLTLDGHTDTVNCLAFSPDTRLLASASADHTARLWDLSTGQEVASLAAVPGRSSKAV